MPPFMMRLRRAYKAGRLLAVEFGKGKESNSWLEAMLALYNAKTISRPWFDAVAAAYKKHWKRELFIRIILGPNGKPNEILFMYLDLIQHKACHFFSIKKTPFGSIKETQPLGANVKFRDHSFGLWNLDKANNELLLDQEIAGARHAYQNLNDNNNNNNNNNP